MGNDKFNSIKKEYFRNWRKNNPEKIQKINERFWTKKLQEKEENKKGDDNNETN